ncbi:MAG: metalloregulator ArsR/SmtB family transcription factor [Anaerovibrio sp.]|uniref:ArsR/SmtB family transcription factor n=1 Tax=Anaerovibrio sp. TaxID=1872532 RepID=UPI0025D4E1A1|nr:metalloregulator ArsR/SmtB family transcription factor [Anaerovibrio sp.]MCR5176015.1 metalloregulator ArsR/SmtB family transcription factor [Anaerovibrio sp.]
MSKTAENIDVCEIHNIHPDSVARALYHQLDDTKSQQLANIFKILGVPTRIKLLSLLISEEMCVCDIAEALNMEQSAISHQLRVLRDAHLVKFRREGKEVWYSLDDDHVVTLMSQGMEHIMHL